MGRTTQKCRWLPVASRVTRPGGGPLVGMRRNRRLERRGVNALRTLLEDAGHIVQEIDGGNDHGEDLYVRFVIDGRLTSSVAAVQVKAGSSYRRSVGYAIPVGTHANLWRTSNIPILGVVYDQDMRMLYWRNITEYLASNSNARSIPIGESDILTADNVRDVCTGVDTFIRSFHLELTPNQGQSLRDTIVARLTNAREAQRREQAVGGNPNLIFEGPAKWFERHDHQLFRLGLIGLKLLIAVCGLMTWNMLYLFAAKHAPHMNPWMWSAAVGGFCFCALWVAYYEQRAGRRATILKLVALTPLMLYSALSQMELSKTTAAVLTALGSVLAGKGVIILAFLFIGRELSRRRRLRAAYGKADSAE